MQVSDFSWAWPFIQQIGHLVVDHGWSMFFGGGAGLLASGAYSRFRNDEYTQYRDAHEFRSWVQRKRLKFDDEIDARDAFKAHFLETYRSLAKKPWNQERREEIAVSIEASEHQLRTDFGINLKRVKEVRAAFEKFVVARDELIANIKDENGKTSEIINNAAMRMKIRWLDFFNQAFEPHSDEEIENLLGLNFWRVPNLQRDPDKPETWVYTVQGRHSSSVP